MSDTFGDGPAARIVTLLREVDQLRERVATLEGALSDSTRRELLLDQRRATLEGELRGLSHLAADKPEAALAWDVAHAVLGALHDQERWHER